MTANLLTLCGGSIAVAAETALAVVRALWKTHSEGMEVSDGGKTWLAPRAGFERACLTELKRSTFKPANGSGALLAPLFEKDSSAGDSADGRLIGELLVSLFRDSPGDCYRIERDVFHPVSALKYFLAAMRRDAEFRYIAMRSLRVGYDVRLSVALAREVKSLAAEALLCSRSGPLAENTMPGLEKRLAGTGVSRDSVHLFLELCIAVEAIRPLRCGHVRIDSDPLDVGNLLTYLFGFPTSIDGFDDLFRGGLLLSDSVSSFRVLEAAPRSDIAEVGSRTVLVSGPFGSGKSLLSLLMAVEVARKGGIAWVMAVEQTPEECIYSLESIGINTSDPAFVIVRDEAEVHRLLTEVPGAHPMLGQLVFCPLDDKFREQFLNSVQPGTPAAPARLEDLENKVSSLSQFQLSLLVIDPISALGPPDAPGGLNRRTQMAHFLKEARDKGVNVWLTSEDVRPGPEACRFEENIADTVIQLRSDDGYFSQRLIRVTKSRLQRERRGPHVLQVGPPAGMRIIAPSSSYASLPRRDRLPGQKRFATHVPGLDRLLGTDSVMAGDLLVFDGISGTAKTLLGLLFLRGQDINSDNVRSLFLSDFSIERMLEIRDLACRQEPILPGEPRDVQTKEPPKIECLSIKPGLTEPADILRRIARRFQEFKNQGQIVDRILLANLSRWELDMPRLKDDPAFGVALLQLLRSSGATSIVVTGYPEVGPRFALREVVLEASDSTFEFQRVSFRGRDSFFLRILKTRDMLHRRGRFEVIADPTKGLRIRHKESLLRVDAGGTAAPVPAVLFLHAETPNHAKFNASLVDALKTSALPRLEVQSNTWRFDPDVLKLGRSSVVDQLQVIQLDEFQVRSAYNARSRATSLYPLPLPELGLDDRVKRLRDECFQGVGEARECVAVPLYENISLLAYRNTHFGNQFPGHWETLAEECREWELKNRKGLFFGCYVAQADRHESYNCFFLEILYSLMLPKEEDGAVSLKAWMESDSKLVVRAARCFRQLVRRCHLTVFRSADVQDDRRNETDRQHSQFSGMKDALVWRHWYNTLNQMLSSFDPDKLSEVTVRPLYGHGSPDQKSWMTTAGAWYLAVPPYSAAPEVAFDVIEHITSYDKELQRAHVGAGLPTRAKFYESSGRHSRTRVSKYFELEMPVLRDLVENAFQRSRIRRYDQLSEILSSHLVRLVELPGAKPKDRQATERLNSQIEDTIASLIEAVE